MKNTGILLLLCAVVLVSCSEKQDVNPPYNPPRTYSNLLPAEDLKSRLLVGLSDEYLQPGCKIDSIYHAAQGDRYTIYFARDVYSIFGVMSGSKEADALRNFLNITMTDANAYLMPKNYTIQYYYYARVKLGARIYADKIIAGRKPGADLSDLMYFSLPFNCKVQLTYPDYQLLNDYYGHASHVSFSDYFKEGTALPAIDLASVSFIETPAEQYDEITYTIEIPFECEYMQQIIFGKDYEEKYYEQGLVERNENRMLKGSVTVRFD